MEVSGSYRAGLGALPRHHPDFPSVSRGSTGQQRNRPSRRFFVVCDSPAVLAERHRKLPDNQRSTPSTQTENALSDAWADGISPIKNAPA
ncbi:hypothetical protein APA63_31845 [Pseudomonas aeruginosa]|nr:hypothetical protein APA63_31845 [Pseudomonas aeruginosa]RUI15081.1 hypothetical protein IPC448_21505 [Pseudomonas aeruginosa]